MEEKRTARMNFVVDADIKRRFEEVTKSMGMTPSAALTMFVTATVNEGGLPFRPSAAKVGYSVVQLEGDGD